MTFGLWQCATLPTCLLACRYLRIGVARSLHKDSQVLVAALPRPEQRRCCFRAALGRSTGLLCRLVVWPYSDTLGPPVKVPSCVTACHGSTAWH